MILTGDLVRYRNRILRNEKARVITRRDPENQRAYLILKRGKQRIGRVAGMSFHPPSRLHVRVEFPGGEVRDEPMNWFVVHRPGRFRVYIR